MQEEPEGEGPAVWKIVPVPSLKNAEWPALADRFQLDLIIQFGSSLSRPLQARDLDLAIEGPLKPPLQEAVGFFCHALSRGDLDLSWLPTAGWLLPWEATRQANLLFERIPGDYEVYRNAACLQWMEGRKLWGGRQREYLKRVVANSLTMNRELVLRKSVQIAEHLRQLEETLPGEASQFEAQHVLHHAAERLLELLVEDAAALNTEIGASVAGIPPSDYYSSFFALAQAGWLPQQLSQELAVYASLRNTLVDRYERVELATLYSQLKSSIPLWRAYLAELEKRL